MERLVVVGGGAAGLLAALRAAERSAPGVLVLEAAREPGRKILVSGGGRCNVLPMREAPERFVSSSPSRLIQRFLARFPLAAQRAFFEQLLGGRLREEPETGKLFPPTNRARDVRDALLSRARRLGAEARSGIPVREVVPLPGGGWRVRHDAGEIDALCVLLTTGGKSVLAGGADARGLEWAAVLGHTVRPVFPALVPLVSSAAPHAALSGISLRARVTAESGGERTVSEGGFLFTHRGYSGPAVLDVSHVVERARVSGRTFRVRVRFEPAGEPVDDWDATLRSGTGRLAAFLARRFPDRLVALLVAAAGVSDGPLARMTREARGAVVGALTDFELPVDGTEGFRTAEVTGGGVALEEVDAGSGRSRLHPGLFFAGEILDAFGPIGGFNFQWAWATGAAAGEGAAKEIAG